MRHKENCGTCGLDFEWEDDPALPDIICPHCGQTYSMAMQDEWEEEGYSEEWFYLEPKGNVGD